MSLYLGDIIQTSKGLFYVVELIPDVQVMSISGGIIHTLTDSYIKICSTFCEREPEPKPSIRKFIKECLSL